MIRKVSALRNPPNKYFHPTPGTFCRSPKLPQPDAVKKIVRHRKNIGGSIFRCPSSQHSSASSFECFSMTTTRLISTLNTKVRWQRSISLESCSPGKFARFVLGASFANGRGFMSMNFARIGKD